MHNDKFPFPIGYHNSFATAYAKHAIENKDSNNVTGVMFDIPIRSHR